MQSYNEATLGIDWTSCVLQKNARMKGKENGLNAPTCLQPGIQKPTSEKLVLQDTLTSRLPLLSKSKNPPDFQKLHQSWQDQFQKGKAVKKKSCTRPQPFNFSQRRDRSQVTTDIGPSGNPPVSYRRREPLAEVTVTQKNQESKDADGKGGSEEFKADPAALDSILSNVGVPVATGKVSLAQRVPMRVSSIAQSTNSCKNMMVRSSMYAVLRSQSASSNLDRMSCFSKMQTKATDQKPLFKQNPLLKSCVPDSCLEGFLASNLDDKLQSQENPVLQQMNQASHTQVSSVTSLPLKSQEVTTVKSTPVPPVTEDAEGSVLPEEKCEKNTSEVESSAGKRDPMKKAGTSVEFVADPQALSSILSHTGVTLGNCGKLSLARRVPVQAKNVSSKSGMTSSGPVAMQATTPKPCFGRISTMAIPIKDIAFSPCRVPKTLLSDMSPSGSAKRVHQLNSSAMKSSQRYFSMSKQTFLSKTPRALALEMANKKLEAKLSDAQPSRSTVKWADELSPSESETLCENELNIEEVAVRLFLDGECPEAEKKKGEAEESDRLKGPESLTTNVQKRPETTLPDNSKNADVAAPAGVSQDLPVHTTNAHLPAPSSLTNTADPPVQYPSILSGMKTSLPLSFLSHPAVQALQSRTLGPYSLPEIARLRIQAAVSAKQRFWETCLDEECAFYTARETGSSYRDCNDPVSSFLERQEDLHFTPIPGEP